MTNTDTTRTDPETARGALLALGRTAGASMVDAQVATSEAIANCQDKLADQSPVRWLGSGFRAQANLTRSAAQRYGSTTRGLLG